MTRDDFDVAIVGYGPVGALAALLLAEAGLDVAVIDRTSGIVPLPRAVGLDGESMRSFQRIGLSDAVDALVQAPREKELYCFTNSKREPLFGLEIPGYGYNGWRDNAYFDQPELEALLREHVGGHRRVETLLGREVVGIEQDDARVTLSVAGREGEPSTRLHAAYVLGCDGASSFVRQALGIDWVSLGYDQDWLVVDVTIGPDAELPLVMMQVCDPERLATYVPVKDPNRRWEFQLLAHETREQMLRPETISSLLDPWLPREHYEIRRAAVYQFHAAMAGRMRAGRVFLAGDAAHQTPPFLGQGLNAGFRDALNLGWKIPLVHAGRCSDALLDSYEDERALHARDLVARAVGIGQLMETLAAREAGLPDPYDAAERHDPPPPGEPVAPPIRGGVLAGDQIRASGPVGFMLRQPRVRDEAGSTVRLDALLGPGFALVGRTDADLAVGPEAARILERLGVRRLALAGLEVVEGTMDALFERHPAAIVRPDRYVFGVVDDAMSLDELVGRLGDEMRLAD